MDPSHYRNIMRHWATGVAIVTARHEGNPIGMTVNSLTSLSLDPLLLLFGLGKTNHITPLLLEASSLGVSILSHEQAVIAKHFVRWDAQQDFSSIAWAPSPTYQVPIITGSTAWMECTLHPPLEGGDHHIMILSPHEGGHEDRDPLLYLQGALTPYHRPKTD